MINEFRCVVIFTQSLMAFKSSLPFVVITFDSKNRLEFFEDILGCYYDSIQLFEYLSILFRHSAIELFFCLPLIICLIFWYVFPFALNNSGKKNSVHCNCWFSCNCVFLVSLSLVFCWLKSVEEYLYQREVIIDFQRSWKPCTSKMDNNIKSLVKEFTGDNNKWFYRNTSLHLNTWRNPFFLFTVHSIFYLIYEE